MHRTVSARSSPAVLRVRATGTLPPEAREWFGHATPIADDLLEVLAFDWPTTVTMLRDDAVSRRDLQALRAAGPEHLLREPFGQIERLRVPSGATVDVVEGEPVRSPSRVLVLPDVLRRVHGERTSPDGLLVALPDRHHLLLHAPDGPDAVPVLQAVVSMTAQRQSAAVGGLSPSVYWWREGTVTRLSSVGQDRRLRV